MARVFIMYEETIEDNHRSSTVEDVFDSEEKVIAAIQRRVKCILHLNEVIGGPKPHVTYLIDHVPTEDEIRAGDVHYSTIDGEMHILRYHWYVLN